MDEHGSLCSFIDSSPIEHWDCHSELLVYWRVHNRSHKNGPRRLRSASTQPATDLATAPAKSPEIGIPNISLHSFNKITGNKSIWEYYGIFADSELPHLWSSQWGRCTLSGPWPSTTIPITMTRPALWPRTAALEVTETFFPLRIASGVLGTVTGMHFYWICLQYLEWSKRMKVKRVQFKEIRNCQAISPYFLHTGCL